MARRYTTLGGSTAASSISELRSSSSSVFCSTSYCGERSDAVRCSMPTVRREIAPGVLMVMNSSAP